MTDPDALKRLATWIHNNLDGADCGILTIEIETRQKQLIGPTFDRVVMPSFKIDKKRTRRAAYSMPITKIIEENSLKDFMDMEDAPWVVKTK
jgi:hypothetical protein